MISFDAVLIRYGESSPLLWNKLAANGHSSVRCPPPAEDGPAFHIEVRAVFSAINTIYVSQGYNECLKTLLVFQFSKLLSFFLRYCLWRKVGPKDQVLRINRHITQMWWLFWSTFMFQLLSDCGRAQWNGSAKWHFHSIGNSGIHWIGWCWCGPSLTDSVLEMFLTFGNLNPLTTSKYSSYFIWELWPIDSFADKLWSCREQRDWNLDAIL